MPPRKFHEGLNPWSRRFRGGGKNRPGSCPTSQRYDLEALPPRRLAPAAFSSPRNTMALGSEAIVLWPCPLFGFRRERPAEGSRGDYYRSRQAPLLRCLAKNILPRDICTREAFENAATIVRRREARQCGAASFRPWREAGIAFEHVSCRGGDLLQGATALSLRSEAPSGALSPRHGGRRACHLTALWMVAIERRLRDVTGMTNRREFAAKCASIPTRGGGRRRSARAHGRVVGLSGNLAPEGASSKVAGLKHIFIIGRPARVFDAK